MNVWKKTWKITMAMALCLTAVFGNISIHVKAAGLTNLALNKSVTASAQYSTMPASYLTDGNESTRWSTEQPAIQWAYVDLGETKTMNKFDMLWESKTIYATAFNIYVTNDLDDWGTPVKSVSGSTDRNAIVELETPVSGRYVKLEVTQQGGVNNVSCYEFKIYNDPAVSAKVNLALGKPVTASLAHADLPASNLTDGNDSTRWSSETKPIQWAYVDLGETKTMNKFDMLWESKTVYATAFNIYVSDDKDNWGTPVVSVNDNKDQNSIVSLDTLVSGRYVKLEVTQQAGYPSVSCYEFKIFNDPTLSSQVNIALHKSVTASAQYGTMPASYLTDGDDTTRWSSETAPTQWAYIDLGSSMMMNKFDLLWQDNAEYAVAFNIYVSDDKDNWGTAVVSVNDNTDRNSVIKLDESVSGRYVKLEVTKVSKYPSVSCMEFKIFNELVVVQNPESNVALHKSVQASSSEANSVRPALAVDGDTTSTTSRWGSNLGDASPWIYVDLGEKMNVKTVKLYWQNRKATAYKIQIADTLHTPMQESDWTTVKTIPNRPIGIEDKISLDQVYETRYVRLKVDSFTGDDPDGGVAWDSVSLYEIEIYGGDIKKSIVDIANEITVETPQKGDTKLQFTLPNDPDFTVTYNGTDFEQVVDRDRTIYTPLVDKTVSVSFKVTDNQTNEYRFKEIPITVPGKYHPSDSVNAAPNVLPELQEWKGNSGNFTASAASRIIYKEDSLYTAAEEMALDYEDLFGAKLTVTKGTEADVRAGDFYFALTTDTSKGYQDEGYYINIGASVKTESETATGAYWATRTILQSLKASGNIPCGETRDYPLYEVRGYILDVGRKTFTMDFLEQTVKQMSWYKMNDFHVHLNDNLIPLEALSDPMSAYSGFRLESDVKKGGNNGLNQADLTSTDVWYTKDEFRSFIQKSRALGVNIIPELDAPAHSLAFTKVRPDLRNGTNGRQNDHLALVSKYNECLSFIQSIFNEYLTGTDPVFDSETIVHIGADEFSADQSAYVNFANDMIQYMQGTGRTVRIWGSMTHAEEAGADLSNLHTEGVQMNLWNYGWANIDHMYELGFDLINCNDGNYYIVPNAGYYYDRIGDGTLYNLPINTIAEKTIPAGDKQMLGGAFAVWNDMTDYLENGVSEYDVFLRTENAFPLFGAKLWGKGNKDLNAANATRALLGDAPRTNFGYEVESKENAIGNYPMDSMEDLSLNENDLTAGNNAQISSVDGKNALQLKGGESYINTDYTTIGLGNDLRVKVKRTSESNDDQILFESDYGTIKAVQGSTGKVGFTRENRDYSFAYTLPVNEWVELEFKNSVNVTQLYVNGVLVDTIGDDELVEGKKLLATTMFPFARIGSKTNAFIGYVDDVRIGSNDTFYSTMELDHAVVSANKVLMEHENEALRALVEQAHDVFKQYAPTQAEIDSLKEQINTLLKTIDFEKADYSRVEHYLELIPKDLTLYTNESVENLNRVIDSIKYDLPLSMQETVDGYEYSLATAIQELVLKEAHNPLYVDHNDLTMSASSYQGNDAHPNKVIDHDPTTIWHTQYSLNQPSDMPHWISFEIKEPTDLSGLIYTPRSNLGNGVITKYRIATSDDGTNWNDLISGDWAYDTSDKVVNFTAPITTKYIRLYADEAYGNYASAAEIRLVKANIVPDIDGLKALIEQAETLLAQDCYTQESADALAQSVGEANAVVDDPASDANVVEIAKRDLLEKIAQMTLVEKPDQINKTSLQAAITRATAITEADLANVISDAVVSEFKAALQEAQFIMANTSATQAEVDASVERLSNAMHQLSINTRGNKENLQKLVNDVAGKKQDQYTTNSWGTFANALTKANQVLANSNALQNEIDQAYDALQKAVKGLTPIGTSNPGEDDPDYVYSITDDDSDVSVIGKFPIDTTLVVEVLEEKPISEIIALIKDTSFTKKYQFEKIYDIYMLRNGVVYQTNTTFNIRIKLDESLKDKNVKVVYISDDGEITEVASTIRDGYISFSTDHNSYYALVTEKEASNTITKPITDTATNANANGLATVIVIGAFLFIYKKLEKEIKC